MTPGRNRLDQIEQARRESENTAFHEWWKDMYVKAANQRDAAESRVRELEERLETAMQALEDILAPIAKAQRELEPGQRLSGMAYSILTSAENLREIARTALSQIRSEK